MSKIVNQETKEGVIEGKPVTITTFFHSTNPYKRRTIRTLYKENMPHKGGSWLANTTTERVVDGHGASFKEIIPEHRVA